MGGTWVFNIYINMYICRTESEGAYGHEEGQGWVRWVRERTGVGLTCVLSYHMARVA